MHYALGMIGLAMMVALPVATAVRMATLTEARTETVTLSDDATGVSSGSTATTFSTDGLGSIAAAPGEAPASASLANERGAPVARTASEVIPLANSEKWPLASVRI